MPTEQCYGVIVVYKGEEDLFLVLLQDNGFWSFPKGHSENQESPKETVLRELEEETKIKEIKLLDFPLIHEEYPITRDREKRLKINDYFIGFVKDKTVVLDQNEVLDHKWLTYEEALDIFTYSTRKETLQKAKEYLDMIKS